MGKVGNLFIYSGPSGVGKGTLLHPLLKKGEIELSISATTRKKRPGETHGVEYYFIESEEFEKMIEDGKLLEYARYGDNYYGTPRQAVEEKLKNGINVVLEIETKGASQVRKIYPEAISIFILPPSLKELRKRLVDRKTETPEAIEKRLSVAADEIKQAINYDFIIVNNDANEASELLGNIIKSGKAINRLNKNKIEEVLSKC